MDEALNALPKSCLPTFFGVITKAEGLKNLLTPLGCVEVTPGEGPATVPKLKEPNQDTTFRVDELGGHLYDNLKDAYEDGVPLEEEMSHGIVDVVIHVSYQLFEHYCS